MSTSTTESAASEPLTAEAPVRVDVIGADGTADGTVELPPEIFGVQVNVPLIHQVVVAQLAAARQGTSSTKSRGEVRGGGRKPYRQKGTGRARQGSTRAPQFAGGGVVHGPSPRSYAQRTPKKMKAAALRGALSDRARNGRIHVVTGLVEGDVPSTKAAVTSLARLSERRHVLVVLQRSDQLGWKSLRNAETVHILVPDQLNTYDVLVSDDVVFTRGALDEFLAGPAQGKSATATATESEAAALPAATPAVSTEPTDGAPATVTKKAPAAKAPAAKAPADDAPAKKAPAKKTAAKKTASPKETVVTDSENAVDEAAASDDGSDA